MSRRWAPLATVPAPMGAGSCLQGCLQPCPQPCRRRVFPGDPSPPAWRGLRGREQHLAALPPLCRPCRATPRHAVPCHAVPYRTTPCHATASRPCRAPSPAPRALPASRALLSPQAASPVPAGAARAGASLLGSAVKVQSCLASLPGAQAGWTGAQCWAARSLPVCFPRIRHPARLPRGDLPWLVFPSPAGGREEAGGMAGEEMPVEPGLGSGEVPSNGEP